jgi:hypothetical protein
MFNLTINGEQHSVDAEADTPLLWVLRDEVGLTGAKFGCGVGVCGGEPPIKSYRVSFAAPPILDQKRAERQPGI